MGNELKPFWRRIFSFNWKFGLFLILVVCIPRFILVLNANSSGNYSSIGVIMTVSAIAPFIFLSKYGRNKIGLVGSKKYSYILLAFVAGLTASLLLYLLGQGLYGNSYENWYHYIGKSYKIPPGISTHNKFVLFLIMAITGMTFSPIGEEFFFRGIIQSSFANSIGERKASIVEGSAFALTHISHFGLVFIDNKWSLFGFPTVIWVGSMFLVSLLFFVFKKYSKSLLGAIICHSAFNLGMIFCIFYRL